MGHEFKSWHKLVLLLFFPPVGTYFIFTSDRARPAHKVISVVYCLVVMLFILSLRLPVGEITVTANPIG